MKHANRRHKPLNFGVDGLAPRAGSETKLAITYSPTASLQPNPNNPRIHPENQIRQIARSIQTFGFLTPVVVDRNGRLVAGHGRLRAAMLLGIPEVPTVRVEHLTEDQAKAFAIADNKVTENLTWDDRLLGATLKSLSEVELEFSLEATGFSLHEIEVLIEGPAPTYKGQSDSADVLPQTGVQDRVSRQGDLWFLGPHRILCGNPLDRSSYAALMENHRASIVFTEPRVVGGPGSQLGGIKHEGIDLVSHEIREATSLDAITLTFLLLADYCNDGSLHFLCTDWRYLAEVLTSGNHVFAELKNVCVWVKNKSGMDSLYRSQHELVLVFHKGKESQLSAAQVCRHRRTNVWHYARVNSRAKSIKDSQLVEAHRDAKPVAMVADALIENSEPGDIVLDPFLGNGTTLIAAERAGLGCFGMESDPTQVDTAVRRWQTFTGLLATHAISGRSFAELEEEAAHGA